MSLLSDIQSFTSVVVIIFDFCLIILKYEASCSSIRLRILWHDDSDTYSFFVLHSFTLL